MQSDWSLPDSGDALSLIEEIAARPSLRACGEVWFENENSLHCMQFGKHPINAGKEKQIHADASVKWLMKQSRL